MKAKRNFSVLTTGLAVMFLGSVATAAKVTCTSGQTQRTLEVVYEQEGKKVPCKLNYTKDDQTSAPFQAQAQEGYCEEKLDYMKQKLASSGWTCAE